MTCDVEEVFFLDRLGSSFVVIQPLGASLSASVKRGSFFAEVEAVCVYESIYHVTIARTNVHYYRWSPTSHFFFFLTFYV